MLTGLAILVGCGGGDEGAPERPPPGRPALAQRPAAAGEVVVHGEASPGEHGPFRFDGMYDVRFEQQAPEDPGLDFSGEVAFTARLTGASGTVPLFDHAARTGRRTVRLKGRYRLEVLFGDFPYALRFTRRG